MPRVAPFRDFAPLRVTSSARVFVLTGAGISAESGIRTFRDAGGLWEQYRFEEVASPEAWATHPDVVWRFYAQRRAQAATCEPNVAHRALAAAEARLGDRFFLCTQNVDDLHERAGSARLLHMHGELFRSRCENHEMESERTSPPSRSACPLPPFEDRAAHASIPRCACGARIRPHIVWFGEFPFGMERIARELADCDVFVTIGTSGAVYPAAGFVSTVRARGQRDRRAGGEVPILCVYVGPEPPDNASAFDECRLGTAGEAVPGLFQLD
jgi:NAD-dependent deacetylase